ncbi:MAG TPA: hypothetical protein VIH27_03550 [Nitrososphaerales archaeon]
MSLDAARRLVERHDLCINQDDLVYPLFDDSNIHPFPLTKDSFRIVRDVRLGRKGVFVEEGNYEILSKHNFSVQMSEIYLSKVNNIFTKFAIPIYTHLFENIAIRKEVFNDDNISLT